MTKEDLHRLVDALPEDAVEQAGRLLVQQLDPAQAWFWTPEWQAGEREADAQIAAGAGAVFPSDEEFIAHLKREPAPGE